MPLNIPCFTASPQILVGPRALRRPLLPQPGGSCAASHGSGTFTADFLQRFSGGKRWNLRFSVGKTGGNSVSTDSFSEF